MNWDAIGALGEVTGAILLLGSLLYVGIQIRDTKRQMMASAAQSRTESFIELWELSKESGSYSEDFIQHADEVIAKGAT